MGEIRSVLRKQALILSPNDTIRQQHMAWRERGDRRKLVWRLEEGAFCVPNSKSFAIQTGPTDRRMILRILQSSITRIDGDLAGTPRDHTLFTAIFRSCLNV